ncbi:hypothetical protein [Streptomyces soliscabiei]|uniref:hypothetical protein n=1 Tax=Streptomyces soliscabiei TaxID=588897 RepID=UPI0029BB6FFD|nr:hypothetical protein [Streptomyces sp. NY05-11A]MDX2683743.1 hypothetical protein [Streptomyces sp. NY05-11A]
MVATERTPPAEGRRPVGRRAGLDLRRIIDAARSLDADMVTVQAVADKLGVDRKAVRHHATDRETLLKLMALDAFSEKSSDVDIPADCSWQEACRVYALAFADNVIATNALAEHLRLDHTLIARLGAPTEAVAKKLTEAGFDDESALRALALLSNVCMAYAQDVVFVSRSGERPRRLMARETLSGHEREFENFARMVDLSIDTYDRKQLDTSVEVLIHGIEAVLLRRADASGPARRH